MTIVRLTRKPSGGPIISPMPASVMVKSNVAMASLQSARPADGPPEGNAPSVLAEQGGLIAFPILPPARSGERLRLRHIERPWTSFRLGRVFSSLWDCLRRKMPASARLAGPVIILCALRGFTSTQDATQRRATSRARAGCKFVSSRFLATIALVAASTVSTHAQTNWTGTFSSNWFLSGNLDAGSPRLTTDGNINTVTPNSTTVASPGAEARNLSIGPNETGMLTIQTGGTLADSFATVGNLPGGQGTVTVTGAGSDWTNAGSVVVGGLGMGTLTIQDGGTVNSGGGSVGLSVGSIGTVTVTGADSSWINGPSNGLNIGSFGTGTLVIANGGKVINIAVNTANIGNGAGSLGTVMVTGAGSTWSNIDGVNIGNRGTGTLTIADGGLVTGPVVIATNAGSIGTLNIGAGAGDPAAAPGALTAPSIAFGAGAGTRRPPVSKPPKTKPRNLGAALASVVTKAIGSGRRLRNPKSGTRAMPAIEGCA